MKQGASQIGAAMSLVAIIAGCQDPNPNLTSTGLPDGATHFDEISDEIDLFAPSKAAQRIQSASMPIVNGEPGENWLRIITDGRRDFAGLLEEHTGATIDPDLVVNPTATLPFDEIMTRLNDRFHLAVSTDLRTIERGNEDQTSAWQSVGIIDPETNINVWEVGFHARRSQWPEADNTCILSYGRDENGDGTSTDTLVITWDWDDGRIEERLTRNNSQWGSQCSNSSVSSFAEDAACYKSRLGGVCREPDRVVGDNMGDVKNNTKERANITIQAGGEVLDQLSSANPSSVEVDGSIRYADILIEAGTL